MMRTCKSRLILLTYSLKKELHLIFQDMHALLVLFVMPTVFILIMSLAMQNTLGTQQNQHHIKLLVIDQAASDASKKIVSALEEASFILNHHNLEIDKQAVVTALSATNTQVALIIQSNEANNLNLSLMTEPVVDSRTLALISQTIVGIQTRHLIEQLIDENTEALTNSQTLQTLLEEPLQSPQITYLFRTESAEPDTRPSSVQQSVPAWLIFSMFFILIPVANTFINEKNFGTLERLQSMELSTSLFLIGKIIPYFLINQIQIILMLAIGRFGVPLLGGQALEVNGPFEGLIVMGAVVSLAAISFALLISAFSKTTEMSTTTGGMINIVFGAIGGIMVPKFVMPEAMQSLTQISPMAWGLEGFLGIILHGQRIQTILPEILLLVTFAATCLLITILKLNKSYG